jgi:hypothetical protein
MMDTALVGLIVEIDWLAAGALVDVVGGFGVEEALAAELLITF